MKRYFPTFAPIIDLVGRVEYKSGLRFIEPLVGQLDAKYIDPAIYGMPSSIGQAGSNIHDVQLECP